MGGGGAWKLISDMLGMFATALVASGDYRGDQCFPLAGTLAELFNIL